MSISTIGLFSLMRPSTLEEDAVPETIREDDSNTPSPTPSSSSENINSSSSKKTFELIWPTSASYARLRVFEKKSKLVIGRLK